MKEKIRDMSNIFDSLQNPEKYKRELYRAFKRIFSGTIKESFLIEMVDKVENDPRDSFIFLGNNNPDKLFSFENAVTRSGYDPTGICKMIVMCHYANTVMLSDYDRGKQQDSKLYKDKLTDDVIKMSRFEKLATYDFSNSSLESYLPIIFYTAALNNYLGNKYEELSDQKIVNNQKYNYEFNFRMIYKLIMKIKACISLADIRATDELMVIYRTLIELFMTYAALWDQSDAVINSFYEFDQAAFDNNYNGTIPENMKLMAKDMGVNEIKFVNYGWIKNLPEFKTLSNKTRAFSMGGLAKILDTKCDYFCQDFGSKLYTFYKACNPQTHGTMLYMNYFQLELHIFQNIAVMLKFMCEIMSEHLFNFDFKIGDFDLIDEIDAALADSKKVLDWLFNNQTNLDKTNLDYRDRAICSMRMKS